MKTCPKCSRELSETCFQTNRARPDGKQRICATCQNNYSREHYAKNKEVYIAKARKWNAIQRGQLVALANARKSQPCTDCGKSYPPYVMDFDHVSGVKIDNVSMIARRGWSVKRLEDEMAKCEVVCANCHRIRIYLRRCSSTG